MANRRAKTTTPFRNRRNIIAHSGKKVRPGPIADKRSHKVPKKHADASALDERRFQEIAIHEMLQSRSEHLDKPDPLVGAVLVDRSGKEIGRARRGNLRPGDHCEFTLLKKKNRALDARGSTLYVTLEPCSTRNQPKKSCSRRIVETRVSRVVIGMEDPDPRIYRNGIAYLRNHNVQVDFFDHDLRHEIERQNRAFIDHHANKRGNSELTKAAGSFGGPSYEETNAISNGKIDDFLAEAIQKYLDGARLPYRIPSMELWETFKQLGFVIQDPATKRLVPTVAGMVLFGAHPNRFLPQSRVAADKFLVGFAEGPAPENIAPDGQVDLNGPFFRIVDDLELFFRKHVGKVPQLQGARRVYVEEYPWPVVREAIVNALVHRDYQDGVNVIFQMYRDRIVISNPGLPPPPLTLADLQNFKVKSYRRNPKIADAATTMAYMEARGQGIPSMRDRLRRHGLRDPEFQYERDFLVLTLYGREATPVRLRTQPEILAKLNRRQESLLDLLEIKRSITPMEWLQTANVTRQTAFNDLRRLMILDLIERKGSGRSTYYVLR